MGITHGEPPSLSSEPCGISATGLLEKRQQRFTISRDGHTHGGFGISVEIDELEPDLARVIIGIKVRPEPPIEAQLSVVHTAFLRVYEETVAAMGLHLLDADPRFTLLDTVGAPSHGQLDVSVAPFMAKQNLGPVMGTGAGLGALLTSQPSIAATRGVLRGPMSPPR